jgi:hypothetical protein
MPLLDHFQAPLHPARRWASFLHGWTVTLAGQLNLEVLPRRFVAEPSIKTGFVGRSDFLAFEDEPVEIPGPLPYTPPSPSLSFPVDFAGVDSFEVRIHGKDSTADLAAVLELLSPGHKGEMSHRQAFAGRCASYLQSGVAVLIVDVVTSRRANLHAELSALLGRPVAGNDCSAAGLYAVSYRPVLARREVRLEVWTEGLAVGADLPTLPLWLSEECVVPVDLKKSYTTTCESLRIPRGGP